MLRLAERAKQAATAISGGCKTKSAIKPLACVDVDRMNDPAAAEAALRAGVVRLTIWVEIPRVWNQRVGAGEPGGNRARNARPQAEA